MPPPRLSGPKKPGSPPTYVGRPARYRRAMSGWHSYLDLLVAVGLSYVLGFERELRGASAGVRVFSLIGVGSGVVGMLATHGAPNALAGVVTWIGFIGGGLVFGQDIGREHLIRGITTAAAIFATAGLGAAAGQGYLMLALLGTLLALVVLEVRHVRFLRFIDARHWAPRFEDDPMYAVRVDEPEPPKK